MNRIRFLNVLATCVCMPALAYAQNAVSTSIPESQFSLDSNGVDLATGDLRLPVAAVSIGDLEQGISFVRYQGDDGWRDGIDGRVVNGAIVSVIIGGQSEKFTRSGTYPTYTFTPIEANGSTLTFDGVKYVYTAGPGTYAEFSTNYSDIGDYHTGQNIATARITLLRAPNGLQRQYGYGTWQYSFVPYPGQPPITLRFHRLNAVTTNSGFRMELSYELQTATSYQDMPQWLNLTQVKAFNTRLDSCPTFGNGCTSSEPRPSIAISQSSTSTFTYTDAGGRVTTVTKNPASISVQPPGGAPTLSYILTNGRVTQATLGGVNTNYSYSDSSGIRTTIRTTPAGTETHKFDIATLLPNEVTGISGAKTTYHYNTQRQLAAVIAPEGDRVDYTRDTRGNATVTTLTPKSSSGNPTITLSAGYDATCVNPVKCNKPNWTKAASHVGAPAGPQTDYSYDTTTGLITTVLGPAPAIGGNRPKTAFGYGQISGITKLTTISSCSTATDCPSTVNERKTTINYGAWNVNNVLPQSITVSAGDNSIAATTSMTYTALGDIDTVDGPLAGSGDSARTIYDLGLRRVRGMVMPDPDGAGAAKPLARRFTHDSVGRLHLTEIGTVDGPADTQWTSFIPAQAIETVYDANGRIAQTRAKTSATINSLTQTSYDTAGRIECVASRMNPAVFGSLPASACTPGSAGAHGADRITRTEYDVPNRKLSVTSGYGTADASTEISSYSANGKVASLRDGESNFTTYAYDGHDRLWRTCFQTSSAAVCAGSPADYEQLSYDAAGNIISRRLRDNNVLGYTYDALNRLTHLTTAHLTPDDQDIAFTYDHLGQLTKAAKNALNQTAMTYDALGRRTGESNYYYSLTSQYDLAGRRTRLTWNDGLYITYDYDVTGNMTAIRENGATSGIGVLATISYDGFGRRTNLIRGNGTVTSYGYDAASRLASLGQDLGGTAHDINMTFGHNPANQMASRTASNDVYAFTGHYNINRGYTTNGLNQYTASGAIVPSYDARGNMTSAGPQTYAYSSLNRLANVPGTTQLFTDSLGRLDYVSVESMLFAYDGPNLASEISYNGAPGSIARRYVYGPGTDEALVWYEGSGTMDRRWLHADERGSIVAVTNASGAALAINSYDEYGIPATTNLGRIQYTGQKWIPSIGMYDYKARTYSPTLGRFMQTDPIGYGDGMNWYNYVGSDPVNFSDPTGLQVECTLQQGSDPFGSQGSDTGVECTGGPDIIIPGQPLPPNPVPYTPPFEAPTYDGGQNMGPIPSTAGGVLQTVAAPQNGIPPGAGAKSRQQAEIIARRIANQELARTRRITDNYRLGGHNDIFDAERHARWVYRMAMEIGSGWAGLFASGHEIEGLFSRQPLMEMQMDLSNNSLGLNAAMNGSEIPNLSTHGLVYIHNGQLVQR